MGVYGDVPTKQLDIVLPSSDPKDPNHIWGPSEFDYWDETTIMSKSQRTEVNPNDPENPLTVINQAMFEYLVFHTWVEGQETGWNLHDATGKAHERNAVTLNRLFKGETGRKDRQFVVSEVVKACFPEMVRKETLPQAEQEQLGNSPSERETSNTSRNSAPIGSMPSGTGGTPSSPASLPQTSNLPELSTATEPVTDPRVDVASTNSPLPTSV